MGDYSPHVLELARKAVAAARRARQQPGAGRHAADRDARLPALQGVPGLHLERLRQPADRRDRAHRRAPVPGRGARRARRARTPSASRPSWSACSPTSCRTWSAACCGSGRSCCPRRCPSALPTPADAVTLLARGLGRAAAGRALRAAEASWTRTRSRRASAASCCGRSSLLSRRPAHARQQRRRGQLHRHAAAAPSARRAAMPRSVRDRHPRST